MATVEDRIAALEKDVADLITMVKSVHEFVEDLKALGAQAASSGGMQGAMLRSLGLGNLGSLGGGD